MARHVARAHRLLERLDASGGEMPFVDEVLVLPRAAARTTSGVELGATRLSLRPRRRRAA